MKLGHACVWHSCLKQRKANTLTGFTVPRLQMQPTLRGRDAVRASPMI
jgi:hypothetical protein